jgi:predicted nucleic acid-binding protein
MKENIKPEDLKELEAELIKALNVVEIIHEEPLVPQEISDTIEEHYEKKAKKPRVKRNVAQEE